MAFENHLSEVLSALSSAKQQILNNIGTFGTAEAQLRATVGKKEDGDPHPGLMRRSTTFQIVSDNEVDLGVTKEAVGKNGEPYPLYIEKGTSKMAAQPFIEPAIMDNIDKLQEIAGQAIKANMSGD